MEDLKPELTLETLPKAFTQLANDLSEIKRLLIDKSNKQPMETDRWFDLTELCNYLPDKPAKPTVYSWVRNSLIPCHKGQKKLRFLKSEIDRWLKTGKLKTISEIETDSIQYLRNKKGVNHGK